MRTPHRAAGLRPTVKQFLSRGTGTGRGMDIYYVERGLAHAGPIPPPSCLRTASKRSASLPTTRTEGMYACGWLEKSLGSHSFCWLFPDSRSKKEANTHSRPTINTIQCVFSSFLFLLPAQAPQTRPPISPAQSHFESSGLPQPIDQPRRYCMLPSSPCYRTSVGSSWQVCRSSRIACSIPPPLPAD